MKQKLTGWAQQYGVALQKHLKQRLQPDLLPALRLGRKAVFFLKREARSHSQGLKNAIASAQRRVVMSAKSGRRFVCKLDTPRRMLASIPS